MDYIYEFKNNIIIKTPKKMETKVFYITGFEKLNKTLDKLEQDPKVIEFEFECESRGESDDTHEYFVQVITN